MGISALKSFVKARGAAAAFRARNREEMNRTGLDRKNMMGRLVLEKGAFRYEDGFECW